MSGPLTNETETFQHYQVLRREDGTLWELGRGAMGVTYKAFDINLRCHVALKVISAAYLEHPLARQRFTREARAAAQIRHRHIASVYHLGMDAQNFFYAMEFIDGDTLDTLVRRNGPLPPETALRIGIQVARALSAAAKQRLVHRDIKPANIMVVREDHDDDDDEHLLMVKVIDFGLARSAARGEVSSQLSAGGFIGTPLYASPEQLDEKDLDVRSDLYSLGLTLWFLLAARPPFTGTLTSLITQRLTRQMPWEQLEHQPKPIHDLLAYLLQRELEKRPQTAGEARRAMEACLRAITEGLPAGVPAPDDSSVLLSGLPEADDDGEDARRGALGVGEVVAERFRLTRFVGEGTSGRVFQAQDVKRGETVAAKLFHAELIVTPRDYQLLAAGVAKVRAAPHPNLLEIAALERHRDFACVATEWAGGLTLVDVLRLRGTLTVRETLGLLRQAADAADHAREHGLSGVELALHQVLVVPPVVAASEMPEEAARALLSRVPLTVRLKIDALGSLRGAGELATWAGGGTASPSKPSPLLVHDTNSATGAVLENPAIHALALLFYELINGTPPPAGSPLETREAGGTYLALPSLGDAGNAVLKRALTAAPGFADCQEFYEALAKAAGFEAKNLGRPASVVPAMMPAPAPAPGIAAVKITPLKLTPLATPEPPDAKKQAVAATVALRERAQMAGATLVDDVRERPLPYLAGLAAVVCLLALVAGMAIGRRTPGAVIGVTGRLSPRTTSAERPAAAIPAQEPVSTPESTLLPAMETAERAVLPAAPIVPSTLLKPDHDLALPLAAISTEADADADNAAFSERAATLLAAHEAEGFERDPANLPVSLGALPASFSAADDDADDGDSDAKAASDDKNSKKVASASRSHSSSNNSSSHRKRQPTGQPNFWQRLFGLRPPKPHFR